MAIQQVNLGATGTGAGGDTARLAFEKINANFSEQQTALTAQGTALSSKLDQTATAADSDKLGGALAADFYRRANILGTVSQSGGLPSGAIIERGSNVNGEYVRFADGTQICTFNATIDMATPNRAMCNWYFPAVFAVDPWFVDIIPDISRWFNAGWPFAQISGTAYEAFSAAMVDGVRLHVMSTGTIPSGSVGGNKCYAIGRWF